MNGVPSIDLRPEPTSPTRRLQPTVLALVESVAFRSCQARGRSKMEGGWVRQSSVISNHGKMSYASESRCYVTTIATPVRFNVSRKASRQGISTSESTLFKAEDIMEAPGKDEAVVRSLALNCYLQRGVFHPLRLASAPFRDGPCSQCLSSSSVTE